MSQNFKSPVSGCIYCRSNAVLTKEHVIPESLGGEFVLLEASCANCATITGRFEQSVTRGMLWPVRRKLGLKSKRLRLQPKTFPLGIFLNDDKIEQVEVPVEMHPAPFFLPLFGLPTAVFGKMAEGKNGIRGFWHYLPKADEAFIERYKTKDFESLTTADFHSYMRMIAKICHGMMFILKPANKWTGCLNEIILGKSDDLTAYVGGGFESNADRDVLHRFHFRPVHSANGRKFMMADIRLFANLGAPTYHVIVAEYC